MNGIAYFRRKRRMTMEELAKRSGVNKMTICNYEKKKTLIQSSTMKLLALADALDVTLDALVEPYDPASLDVGDHYTKPSASLLADTPLARYRKQKNLTMQQLADLLGVRKQYVSNILMEPEIPEKTLAKLCALEGLTPVEFLCKYGKEAA